MVWGQWEIVSAFIQARRYKEWTEVSVEPEQVRALDYNNVVDVSEEQIRAKGEVDIGLALVHLARY